MFPPAGRWAADNGFARLGLIILLLSAGALGGGDAVRAQALSPDEVRLILRCEGQEDLTGLAEYHLHAFGSSRFGYPRELKLPALFCTSAEPVDEFSIELPTSFLWHAVLTVTTSQESRTCESEGGIQLPAQASCSAGDGTLIFEVTRPEPPSDLGNSAQ